MSKVYLQDSTLTAIGNAIRSKTGESGLLLPSQMPAAIEGIKGGGGGTGEIDVKAILEGAAAVGGLNYRGLLDPYYNKDSIAFVVRPKTQDFNYILYHSSLAKDIDMTIDMTNMGSGVAPLNSFLNNSTVEKLRFRVINSKPTFSIDRINTFCSNCYNLKEINDDVFNFLSEQSREMTQTPSIFSYCYSLRKLPTSIDKLLINSTSTSSYLSLTYLYNLDRMEVPICLTINPTKFQVYQSAYTYDSSLSHLIFTNPRNIQYTGAASSSSSYRTINLTNNIGYFQNEIVAKNCADINDGTRPRVTDDATYAQYKNDFYWTTDIDYSRYNKLSAIETLESLPDVTAIGGTWTITFRGKSGSKTDGGAINTMSSIEMEIALNKGWTVTFN